MFAKKQDIEFDSNDSKLVHHGELPRYGSQTGYGAKQPTSWLVYYAKRWRRVYVARYSNAGSTYIVLNGENVLVSLY